MFSHQSTSKNDVSNKLNDVGYKRMMQPTSPMSSLTFTSWVYTKINTSWLRVLSEYVTQELTTKMPSSISTGTSTNSTSILGINY